MTGNQANVSATPVLVVSPYARAATTPATAAHASMTVVSIQKLVAAGTWARAANGNAAAGRYGNVCARWAG
ncbi:MAG: hypothetical protein JWO85_3225 [Candidatus Eremiobacteraeota bacterium]|nr:hypothetical protein [Candidatus Eremiobacteraeota bacterium]